MTALDLIVRGGRVATALDTFVCDIGIRGGKIVALGDDLGRASDTIEAGGKLVLPGGIDSHVHLAQPSGPSIVMADDFETGTRSAAFGGNTTVLPFCLQEKGQSLRQAITAYHAKAEGNCYVDVAFHLIIADPTEQVLGQELPALVADGYTSFKVFMTYEGLALSDLEMLEVMAVARETGALVMVHAENYDAIRFLTDRLERAGKTAPHYHAAVATDPGRARGNAPRHLARRTRRCAGHDRARLEQRSDGGDPPRAEPRAEGPWRDLPAISCADREGPGRAQHGGRQIRLLVRRRATRRARKPAGRGCEQGVFSVFSSDHCPFRYDDPHGKLTPKARTSFRWVPNGIPGVADPAADPVLRRGGEGADRPQPFRRADLDQPCQDLWPLSAQGHDCGRRRCRHRDLGSVTAGHSYAWSPAGWFGLHAL